MKMRQLKKVLSITLASAMLLTSVPTGSMASEQSPASQEAGTEESTPAPAVETPAPETPAPETPAPETPSEETPATETASEETPAPETPSEETTPTETPSEETPAPETPAPETPAPETPSEETPAPETPSEEVIPTETPSEEAVPTETPTETTSPTEAPSETTPTAAPQVEAATTNMPAAEGIPIITPTPTPTEVPNKVVEVKWNIGDNNITYDGKNHIPIPTAEGIEVTCELRNTSGVVTEAVIPGKYEAIAVTTAKNVTLTNAELSFEIIKATVDFRWNEADLVQFFTNKDIKCPKATVGFGDKVIEVQSKTESGNSDVVKKVGTYTVKVEWPKGADAYYTLCDNPQNTKSFEVVESAVKIQAENAEKIYGDNDPKEWEFTVSASSDLDSTIIDGLKEKITLKCEKSDDANSESVGRYDIVLSDDDLIYIMKLTLEGIKVSYFGATFTIKPCEVKVTGIGQEIYYGQKPDFTGYILEPNVKSDLSEGDIIFSCDGKDASEKGYPIIITNKNPNYIFTTDETVIINKLPLNVTMNKGQSKYYGAVDPLFTCNVTPGDKIEVSETIIAEFKDEIQKSIQREEGENVGFYKYKKPDDSSNYTIVKFDNDNNTFEIKKLPVVIEVDDGQSKVFSENDPAFGFDLDVGIDGYATTEDVADSIINMAAECLKREMGETPGEYCFLLGDDAIAMEPVISGDSSISDGNVVITLPEGGPVFTIEPLEITIKDSANINSRSSMFEVNTELPEERKEDVTATVEVSINTEKVQNPDSISWSELSVYTGALNEKSEVLIDQVTYSLDKQNWKGYLPAGTEVTVDAVYDDQSVVAETQTFTVGKTNVGELTLSGTHSSRAGSYITDKETLTLTGAGSELKKVILNNKEINYYSNDVNPVSVSPSNSGSSHNMQSISANILDTLNLSCSPAKIEQFYVDDQAFPISSVQFENRGKELKVTAPENGTITSVSIPNATVTALGDVAAGQEATFAVNWSGSALIPTGSSVSVTYKDEAGHEANGSTTATRSSVSTPLLFTIRPELTAGYLNGESSNLIVSGTGCTCEPISVSVAGMSQDLNVSVQDTWTDSNGTWETTFSMDGLPEGQDFTISAEYKDVNGAGYSINARYDSFCADASVVSPIYEAMTHISGMVEPGTTVALVINGDTQKYKEMKVDRFGRFAYDDVPMLYGGEDSFDIYVRDIAGNTSIRHYEIPEPGDPFEVTGTVNPMGKFLYSAVEEGSAVAIATPVSSDDFAEDEESIEIPLLMGMSYEVGTLTLAKSGDGFTVSGEIQMGEDISSEDYTVEEGKLYVYTSQPSIEDIKEHKGTEYKYGDTISLGNGTVWIVNESNMTILADDMAELSLYDYENSEIYAKYQER